MAWLETTQLKVRNNMNGMVSVRTLERKGRFSLRINGLIRIMEPAGIKTRVTVFLGDGQEYGKLRLARSEAGFAVTKTGQVTISWPRGDYVSAEMLAPVPCKTQWDEDDQAVTIELPECLRQKSEEAA